MGAKVKSPTSRARKPREKWGTQLVISPNLSVHQFHAVDRVPARCRFQLVVDVVDVLYAFGFEPFAEGGCALLGIDRDAVFPRGAAAKHAVELHSGFSGEFERLAEFGIADAGRQVDERL